MFIGVDEHFVRSEALRVGSRGLSEEYLVKSREESVFTRDGKRARKTSTRCNDEGNYEDDDKDDDKDNDENDVAKGEGDERVCVVCFVDFR